MLVKRTTSDTQIILICSHGGKYSKKYKEQSTTQSTRQSSTLKRDCPFTINATVKPDGRWYVGKVNANHNHEILAGDLEGYSRVRRLSEEEQVVVNNLHQSGVKPQAIMSFIRTEGNSYSTMKGKLCVRRDVIHLVEIYNQQQKSIALQTKGLPPLQALLNSLKEKEWSYAVLVDANNNMECLYFNHPGSIELSRQHGSLFLMDCTYQTNKDKLPLLNIVGVTATENSFTLALLSCDTKQKKCTNGSFGNFATRYRRVQQSSSLTARWLF